ncbi:hypothetical protein BJ875DRAFT_213151 [Amylocarpus encephaloides]|uniref:F-box domain-containing protein n=1 Tax=Amylocarpus encephaloides TaxID=45428 RepID=A0A9P8C7V6_9HELO|nr:hypothetical protein BJ875DRAFT_213151 [Amylocarpus encephaloides]
MRRNHKSPFSLRALFNIHSSSNYPRKHHGRRTHHHSSSSRRNRDTHATPASSSYYYPYTYPTTPGKYCSALFASPILTVVTPEYNPYSYTPYVAPSTYDSKSSSYHSSKKRSSKHHSSKSKSSSSRRPKTNLNSLPPELRHQIHSSLDPVSSTCLGLSSRHYYPIHRSKYPKTSLFAMADTDPKSPSSNFSSKYYNNPQPYSTNTYSHPLYLYLNRDKHSQFIPRDRDAYVLDPRTERYVRKARFEERERERGNRGEAYNWEMGREERERELRRLWGREGKLGRRRRRGWFW